MSETFWWHQKCGFSLNTGSTQNICSGFRLRVHVWLLHTIPLHLWFPIKVLLDHHRITKCRTAVITHVKVGDKEPRKCRGRTRVFGWAPKCRQAPRTWSDGTGQPVGWWSWPLCSSASTGSCSKRTPDSSRRLQSNHFGNNSFNQSRIPETETILR